MVEYMLNTQLSPFVRFDLMMKIMIVCLYMNNTLHVSAEMSFIFSYCNILQKEKKRRKKDVSFFPISCSPNIYVCLMSLSMFTLIKTVVLKCWSVCTIKRLQISVLQSLVFPLEVCCPRAAYCEKTDRELLFIL